MQSTKGKVGQSSQTKNPESFISTTNNSLDARAAVLIDSDCKQPELEWNASVKKYGIEYNVNETNLTAAIGTEDVTVPSSGLSRDETVWGCIDDPNTALGMRCGYIVYEINKDSFNLIGKLEHTFTIPKTPLGDRGGDFKMGIEAKLSCDGIPADSVSASVMQDEQDQLRQEYLDMNKKTIPKRKDLTNEGDATHFSINEFNASQKAGGGQHEYILCKILDKLELVRNRAGNVSITINSGFRNPHKNALIPGSAEESQHIYGLAADIRLMDFNHDNKVNDLDRELLAKVAKASGACVEPKDKKGRVHIDWRGSCPVGW